MIEIPCRPATPDQGEVVDKDILAALAALERVHHDEQRCLNLRAAVLAEHRANHVEVDPRFCVEVCQLAAENW